MSLLLTFHAIQEYTLQVLLLEQTEEIRLSNELVAKQLSAFDIQITSVQVSKYAALTEQQYQEWNKVWPLSTRPLPR